MGIIYSEDSRVSIFSFKINLKNKKMPGDVKGMSVIKKFFKLANGFYFIFCGQLIISSHLICNCNLSFGIWEQQMHRT